MRSYLKSFLSLKKILYKNISMFSYWDNKTTFTKDSEIRRFAKLKGSKIGKYSRINPNCKLSNTIVGNFTAIGRDTTIGVGQHPMNYASTQNIFYKKNNMNNQWVKNIETKSTPITIGSDVWIGVEALIMDGVTIGDGAVVGARSVVTKDIPPYGIAVGTPAKVIKYRFDEETIERLLEVKWWDFSDEVISDNVEFFREENLDATILNKYFK